MKTKYTKQEYERRATPGDYSWLNYIPGEAMHFSAFLMFLQIVKLGED